MKVLLEALVFTEAPEWCLPLVWFAFVGKHRVLASTGAQSAFEVWRARLSPRQQDAVEHAENWSISDEASAPSKLEIRVSDKPTTGQVSPTTAWAILQRPYRVLLEDGFNDGAFLLRMAGSAERAYLQERFAREWLEADHGGGISSMPRHVKQLAASGAPLLASCLFDSDSATPGLPSKDSVFLGKTCAKAKMHHYRLARRAIENYLPRSAFETWTLVGSNRTERLARRLKVRDFFDLVPSNRHHVNVKEHVGAVGGLKGDDSAMNDRDLASEGGPAELQSFVRELIERVR